MKINLELTSSVFYEKPAVAVTNYRRERIVNVQLDLIR